MPYHVHQPLYDTMYQPCTSTHVPYHAPRMYLNHMPYHLIISYTIHHNISTMKCLKKVPKHVPRSPTYASNHALYHQPYTSKNVPVIHIPCTSNKWHITHDIPQPIIITMCQYIQDMHRQCNSTNIPQSTCPIHPRSDLRYMKKITRTCLKHVPQYHQYETS